MDDEYREEFLRGRSWVPYSEEFLGNDLRVKEWKKNVEKGKGRKEKMNQSMEAMENSKDFKQT